MSEPAEVIEFRPPEIEQIVQAMHDLANSQHGWITFQPGVRQEDVPPARSTFGGLFSGTGPPVPVGTWVAPEPNQKPPHAELGLLHSAGPKAVRRLGEEGHDVPDHWVVLADHPRRGLVVAIHPDSPHIEVLDWLLRAATLLTRVPLTGAWQASIHGRS